MGYVPYNPRYFNRQTGFLLPRLTTAQRDAIDTSVSAFGFLIFNTDTLGLEVSTSVGWVPVATGGNNEFSASELANGTTGSGEIVLASAATINSPTLNSPTITGTVTGLGEIIEGLSAENLTNGVVGSGATVLQSIAPTNTRKAVTGTYTVLASDAGLTLALGGDAFYQVTVPAASGLTAQQVFTLVNEDTGRGKFINVTGSSAFYLWPGQVATVLNQNNVWQVNAPLRWKVTGALTFNFDPVNGTDTFGATDGLGLTTQAFKTASNAVSFVADQIEWDTDGDYVNTQITLLNAAGATDTSYVHFSPHGLQGAQGGAALKIDLNGGSANPASTCWLQGYFGLVIQVRNGTLNAPGAGQCCINAVYGCTVYILDEITFGTLGAGSAHVLAQDGARVEFSAPYTISGGNSSGYHLQNLGGVIRCNQQATLTTNVSFANFIFHDGGVTDVNGFSVNNPGNAYSISAAAYNVLGAGDGFALPSSGLYTQILGLTAGSWNGFTSFTPSISPSAGAFSSVTANGLVRARGNAYDVQYDFTINNVGSATSGGLLFQMPIGGGAIGNWAIHGIEMTSGKAIVGQGGSGGQFTVAWADGTSISFSNGQHFVLNGSYQGVAH